MTIQQCQPFRAGLLTEEEAQDANAPLMPEDIVMRLNGGKHKGQSVELENGFIGLRCRGDAVVDLDTLVISKVKNDALQCWSGGLSVEHLDVDHSLPVKYEKANHPDVFQAFGKWLESDKQSGIKSFDGLYIGSADIRVRCHGKKDKKNGFMFTEMNEYRNIVLFPNGITYDSNSPLPYFIDMTSGQYVTIGSQDNPIDPLKVSNKGIRIGGQGGTKTGAPRCEMIVIHAIKGLSIKLGADARKNTIIHEYDRKEAEQVDVKDNHRWMSPEGVKALIESEGTINTLYYDEANYATIGIGHLVTPTEKKSGKITLYTGDVLDFREGLSTDEVKALLKHDLRSHCSCIDEAVITDINQGQFDALSHFVFNIGVGGFKSSTLLKRLNADRFDDVPHEFRRWNKITVKMGGKSVKRVSEGLVNRREKVVKMWEAATNEGFSIDSYVGTEKPKQEGGPIYDAPVATTSEMLGHGRLGSMVKSRSIWGAIGGLFGFGSLGGIGTTLSNKVNETVTNAINDPVGAIQGAQAATVDATKLLEGVEKLQSWFLYGGIALLIGILGILVVILARLDDRKKGYR